jgi:hypothetical protein
MSALEGAIVRVFGKDEPETVLVRGRPLRCLVCQHDAFYQRKAQLHSGIATFFQLEWSSPTCVCVVCSACGYVHWFLP